MTETIDVANEAPEAYPYVLYPRDKAVDVAYLVLEVVNKYKEAVHLPQTYVPLADEETERFNGIVNGVLHTWMNPEQTAEDNHDAWLNMMEGNGWVYGEVLSETDKTHPAMVPYDQVPNFYKVNDILFLNIVNANKPQPL